MNNSRFHPTHRMEHAQAFRIRQQFCVMNTHTFGWHWSPVPIFEMLLYRFKKTPPGETRSKKFIFLCKCEQDLFSSYKKSPFSLQVKICAKKIHFCHDEFEKNFNFQNIRDCKRSTLAGANFFLHVSHLSSSEVVRTRQIRPCYMNVMFKISLKSEWKWEKALHVQFSR